MEFIAIDIEETSYCLKVRFTQAEKENAINSQLLKELNMAIDLSEKSERTHALVLEGSDGVFCTGLDFTEIREFFSTNDEKQYQDFVSNYMKTLTRLVTTPSLVITHLDGLAYAGGVGFVAASDIVYSTPRSVLCLSEASFGMIPFNCLPFLVRRTGLQKAYIMSMTAKKIDADEAKSIGLIDFVHDNPDVPIRHLLSIGACRSSTTMARAKKYFKQMWGNQWVLDEENQRLAINSLSSLLQDEAIQKKISGFIDKK